MNAHGITIARIIPLELESIEKSATILDEVDKEILPFFEEEACAELQKIEKLLHAWNGESNQNQLKDLRRHFHTIKGAANSIGHVRIGALAAGMEDLFKQFNAAYAFALRTQMIKTSITVLQVIQALMQEARQPKVSPVKKEQIMRAVDLIVKLKHQGIELKGAA
jgi:chemotaxis protein histidine kinase CheA